VLDESSAVDAVVDWYGVADLTLRPQPDSAAQPQPESLIAPQDILVGGQDQNAYSAASPISYVTPAAPPFLLVHGTADAVVPYLQSEAIARALTEAGCRFGWFLLRALTTSSTATTTSMVSCGCQWTTSPKSSCRRDGLTRLSAPRSKTAVLARLGRQRIGAGSPVQDAGPLEELVGGDVAPRKTFGEDLLRLVFG